MQFCKTFWEEVDPGTLRGTAAVRPDARSCPSDKVFADLKNGIVRLIKALTPLK